MPDISVILPVYNGGKYLADSINSVLKQTGANFEFLILDDCSTDESWNFLCKIDNERVTLLRNDTNKGLFYNLNFLIGKCTSPLIKLWSQDDVMGNNALEKIVRFHQYYPAIGFSYTKVAYIDENSTPLPHLDKIDHTPTIINRNLHAEICFLTGSIAGNIANVTISKFALDKVGLFNESMRISADFEMWVRITKFFEIGFLNEPLIILRNHSGQLSRQEKYYANHAEEDIMAYKYLFSYLSPEMIKKGRVKLRSTKLVFYYTLMLKSLVKGRFSVARQFWKCINEIDNGVIVFFYFLKFKILRVKKANPFFDHVTTVAE